jgi:hypothetical protein
MLEEPLSGGHMTQVVRIGDSVHRSAGPSTPTIQRLLAHVRSAGVEWVPEPRGLDEQGREVLSYIEGEVPHAVPAWLWSEAVLGDVARALREWHDATATFDRTGAVWGLPARDPDEVVCHSDFAPYNCVFRAGRFAGAIDFDLCSPGPRLWDIAYTAYRFAPLMPPADAADVGPGERSPFPWPESLARLDTFLSAYAGSSDARRYARAVVVQGTAERLGAIAAWTDEHVARTGDPALAGHGAMYRGHAAWLLRNVG